jgi:hypothetical protein
MGRSAYSLAAEHGSDGGAALHAKLAQHAFGVVPYCVDAHAKLRRDLLVGFAGRKQACYVYLARGESVRLAGASARIRSSGGYGPPDDHEERRLGIEAPSGDQRCAQMVTAIASADAVSDGEVRGVGPGVMSVRYRQREFAGFGQQPLRLVRGRGQGTQRGRLMQQSPVERETGNANCEVIQGAEERLGVVTSVGHSA